jgi:small-conductance mechanosensitive channel
MHLRVGKWIGAAAVALALAAPLQAQQPAAAAPAEAAVPVDVADILVRADADERYASDVVQESAGPDPTANLVPALAVIATSVSEKQQEFLSEGLEQLPVSRLESLSRHWKFDARRLERWRSDVRGAMAPFGRHAALLAQRRSEWEATRVANAQTLPQALAQRVDSVIARLTAAEQALSVPLSRQIDLGKRANLVDARIQAGLGNVNAAINAIDERLLQIDSPPLWRAPGPGVEYHTFEHVRRAMQIETRFARDYNASNAGHQRELRALEVLILILLLWLSYHGRKLPPGTVSDETLRILKRPVSIWLLLFMMAVLVFERDAPLLNQEFVLLIALVPVLRLVPMQGKPLLGPWPHVATTLYLLLHVGAVLLSSTFVYRYFVLAISILALCLTAWLIRRARSRPAEIRLSFRLVALSWVSAVLLLAAALVISVGNLTLGETLVSGVIDSSYFGLMLYTGIAVIMALLGLLLAHLDSRPRRFASQHAPPMVNALTRAVIIGAAIGWIAYTLHAFRIYRPTHAFLKDLLSREFSVGSISLTLGHVLVFCFAGFIAYWTARIVRLVLRDEILARMSLPRGVAESVSSLTYYVLILLGFLGALAAAGFNISQLTLVFGALGVGIGFGLQNVVNNFVSGLILMFERPIRPGDWVEVAGASGRVMNIGMRATTIGTADGADVVVPNGMLLSGQLVNWTLVDSNRRIEVSVGVAYGSDTLKVMSILKEAAAGTAGVAIHPPPAALFQGLGSSSLNFAVQAWTADFDRWVAIRSDLYTQVHSALEKAGIEIPFPQQDLRLRSISDEAAASLRPGDSSGGPPTPL